MPAVSVIVPARDAARTLGMTLDGLAAQDLREPYEVVVVDNGSHDDTIAIAEAHPLRPRVLRRARGAGPGAARNDGVRAARADVLAFTDSDCAPEPGWLAAGLAAMEGADLVQGRVAPVEGVPIGPFDHTLWVSSEYGLYETANLFVRRAWFDRAGGFEDWINADRRAGAKPERPFGEDAVFAWRARRAGARTAFAADALVRHAVLPGTAEQYLHERWREGLFARLALHVPELRAIFFHRRLFLSRRTAAFDLAAAGLAVAVARRSPLLAAAAALPWARMVAEESRRRAGVTSGRVGVVVAAGDAVSFASRVRHSVAARTPLL